MQTIGYAPYVVLRQVVPQSTKDVSVPNVVFRIKKISQKARISDDK